MAKHTYSARTKSFSSSASPTAKRKIVHDQDKADAENAPIKKRRLTSKSLTTAHSNKSQHQKTLTQLHFVLESSILRTCPLCGLSYTKGAPDDEVLHRSHCARVQRGMEWGREEERQVFKAGVAEVAANVKLKNGTFGRIISFPATTGGRIGSKLAHLLETINLALASPPLSESALDCSKAYLFLVPSQTNTHREKIIGCVIAQRISTAMAVASPEATATHPKTPGVNGKTTPLLDTPSQLEPLQQERRRAAGQHARPSAPLVAVDTSVGLFCYPTPLPTPLGIPRLFVSRAHRRQGVATWLLDTVARTFIHGCTLDPLWGDVAFTQPTEGGSAVMRSWGKGCVRIYEE